MSGDNITEPNALTDTEQVAEGVRQVRAQLALVQAQLAQLAQKQEQLPQDAKVAVREALQERDSKYKRMLQKIISSALGIVKDPEL